MANKEEPKKLKPILLYDHLPGILAGYPAVMFLIIAALSYFTELVDEAARAENPWTWWNITQDMLFWVGLSIMIVWYIAFRFNLPKSKFWLAFGLLGTFVGIPVVLELTGYIQPFSWSARVLDTFSPSVNAGAWFVMSMIFGIIWISNFVWSRTHLRVRIDETGLTINRWGGKGERFDLIGLKTENEPLDYLELFIGGVGSLSLKTRMNKPIFTLKRVVCLYRIPLFPFFRGKLSRIEEMLSYQGKVVSVDKDERADVAEAMDEAGDFEEIADDADREVDAMPREDAGDVDTPDRSDIV